MRMLLIYDIARFLINENILSKVLQLNSRLKLGTLILAAALAPASLWADETSATLSIHDGRFDPPLLEIPANAKVKLIVKNSDSKPAEFESTDLSREVIIPAHGEVSLFVGPLEPGQYEFFNDFNRSMKGAITVKGGH
jgi:hypothetical protein